MAIPAAATETANIQDDLFLTDDSTVWESVVIVGVSPLLDIDMNIVRIAGEPGSRKRV